jgi:uncharacterized protein (TIGR00369 family)
MTDTETDIPEGFAHHFRPSPVTAPWEPIHYKRTQDAVILGLRVAERHTNSRGLAHGGVLATLADNAMGLSCGAKLEGGHARPVTASLAIDFVRSVNIGQWLAIESKVIKLGRSLCFVQCLITADGAICARANATFSIVKKRQ